MIARGAVAGYAGLAGMGLLFKPIHELQGGDGGPPRTWKEASPAADFAHRVIVGVAHRKVSVKRASQLNNTMHALYAPALGVWYGVFQESLRPRTLPHGLAFGAAVWVLRAGLLAGLQLDEPVWENPPPKIALDAAFHLAFGLAVAYGYREVSERIL